MINRKSSFSAILLIFFLTGIYLFIFGESGILERINLKEKKINLMQRIDDLKIEKAQLQEKLNQYRDGYRPESDITDAGFISPGNKILIVKSKEADTEFNELNAEKVTQFKINRFHYRITWIIISIVVLIIFFSKKIIPRERVNE